MRQDLNALTLSHRVLRKVVQPGSRCIDATAGRGRDTAFLCQLVGVDGYVTALDIQPEAVRSTSELLIQEGLADRCKVVQDSHVNLPHYATVGSLDAITFNLGWLPGGDHSLFTRPDTTIPAIQSGLPLLRPGGVMNICIYYGRDCGFEERDNLLAFLPAVDSSLYSVLVTDFVNRPNNPPIPVFIFREPTK